MPKYAVTMFSSHQHSLVCRYQIQNQTGMTLWYGNASGANHTNYQQGHKLLHGDREELKVIPQQRPVKVLGPGGTVLSRTLSNIIVLHFGGNWMPITGKGAQFQLQ